jgi:hypothetical protein
MADLSNKVIFYLILVPNSRHALRLEVRNISLRKMGKKKIN